MEQAKVQRVSKASSDELLRKFAELDADLPARGQEVPRASVPSRLLIGGPIAVRKKRSRRAISALSARELAAAVPADAAGARTRRRRASSGSVAEWKSLLPVASNRRTPAHASLLRRMGIRRPDDGAPGGFALFLAAAFEKTWRRTVEGASRIFIEKHCQQTHVRLISDIV